METPLTVHEMAGRTVVSTGRSWESVVGYSRAVRVGNTMAVTGTVGMHPDGSYPAHAGEQARLAFNTIIAAIEALGGRLEDVIRTRMYVTDISKWEEVGRVHGEYFGDLRPATTMVEVRGLIDAAALVEIEADAIVSSDAGA